MRGMTEYKISYSDMIDNIYVDRIKDNADRQIKDDYIKFYDEVGMAVKTTEVRHFTKK